MESVLVFPLPCYISQPSDNILSHFITVHILTACFPKVHCNIMHLSIPGPHKYLFLQRFSHKIFQKFLVFLVHVKHFYGMMVTHRQI